MRNSIVAQIEYADWTDVNHLRHSKFVALRDDKRLPVTAQTPSGAWKPSRIGRNVSKRFGICLREVAHDDNGKDAVQKE
jgi:hypothetical protein